MDQASDFVVATRAALAQLSALAVQYSFSVVGAIILLILGWLAAGLIGRWARNGLGRIHGIDATLAQFFSNIIRYAILVLVVVMVLGQFGVQTASVLAALGAVGLAVGLALQGTLQNIAAGIMLLVLRPFRVGESIETSNVKGIVVDVGLFATELRTVDGIYRLAPNSTLWNVPITNYSRLDKRRHDITVTTSEKIDIARAEKLLRDLVAADERVLKNPAPITFVSDFNDGSATVTLRYWAKSDEWFTVGNDLSRQVKLTFDEQKTKDLPSQTDKHAPDGESGPLAV
ncbi:mechanosensitive ion channel family protein [Neorhizobium sp. NPDC001467]|uniref:mechanosensitive ion channel family protein n=1 Tax=Neorhizobium sp. NPDC001467 TaxID=3390595 RepID=UPI003D024760